MRIQFRFKESRVNGVTINYQITAFSFFFLSSIRSSFYPSPVTVTVVKLKLKSRSSSSWTGDSARGVNLLKLLDNFFFLHVFPVFLSIIIHAMLCNRSYFDFPVFSASFLLESSVSTEDSIVILRALLDVFWSIFVRAISREWLNGFSSKFQIWLLIMWNRHLLNGVDDVPSDYEKWAISCVLEGHVVRASSQKPLHIKIWFFQIWKMNVWGCACTNRLSLILNGL